MDEYGDLNLTNGYDEMFLGNLFFLFIFILRFVLKYWYIPALYHNILHRWIIIIFLLQKLILEISNGKYDDDIIIWLNNICKNLNGINLESIPKYFIIFSPFIFFN